MAPPSLAPYVLRRAWLKNALAPVANWYADAAGYRKMGLRADDLIPEESENVQLALKRLPPKELYDRVFRMRRAFQCSLSHSLLPEKEQTTREEDVPYLSPIIAEIEAEQAERSELDTLVPVKN